MNQREREALDRHITGNYGEDQLREQPGMCIWDDCDQDAIYCEGHAREYMQPDIGSLKALNAELVEALTDMITNFSEHIGARTVECEVCTSSIAEARALLAKVNP